MVESFGRARLYKREGLLLELLPHGIISKACANTEDTERKVPPFFRIPTQRFTISEPQKISIGELYEVQKRQYTDFEALM